MDLRVIGAAWPDEVENLEQMAKILSVAVRVSTLRLGPRQVPADLG